MSAVLFVREDLLKASHYKTITVPGHVHGGNWVSPYQKKVLVSDDHNDLNVASGYGSFYQKQAHKKLSTELDHFNTMHPEEKAAVILSHATELQLAASASAAVSGFKSSMLAGKVPTPAQYFAMQNASTLVQGAVADACSMAIGESQYMKLLFAASAKANQTKGKTNEPKTVEAVETGAPGQTQGGAAAPAFGPAKPAEVAEPGVAGQAAVSTPEPQPITVPAMLGKIGPTTFAPAPDFADYAEAQAWIAARAKALGMSKSDFQSSHEFHYAYPKVKAAYAVVKKEFDDKKAETGAALVAEMNAAGVKLGDTVAFTMTGAFLSANHYEGKVVLHGGIPHVKLAHEVAVTKPGGKIGYTKFLQWAPYMKVKGAPSVVVAKEEPIKIKHTHDGFPIKPEPPAFQSTITDIENWIEDGNSEQLKDAVFNLTGMSSVSAKTALAYAEAGVRYLEKKAASKAAFEAAKASHKAPPPPKFTDMNHGLVAKQWAKMYDSGDLKGLTASITTLAGNMKANPALGNDPDTLALMKYALDLGHALPGGPAVAAGPKEGDTKTENGKTYALHNGKWHRVGATGIILTAHKFGAYAHAAGIKVPAADPDFVAVYGVDGGLVGSSSQTIEAMNDWYKGWVKEAELAAALVVKPSTGPGNSANAVAAAVQADDTAKHKAAVAAMEGGAFYQKEAIKKLKAEHGPAWHAMHPTQQHDLAQAKYQALQGAASQAAAVSGWKKHMLAGQVPTPGEVKAFAVLASQDSAKASKMLAEVQGVIGGDKLAVLVSQAHAKAVKAGAFPASGNVTMTPVKPAEPAKVFVTAPPVAAPAPVNTHKDKFKTNPDVLSFITMFKMHGGKAAQGLPIDDLLDPPEIAAFEKLSDEEKVDVAKAIEFYGPEKLNLFMGWVSAQAAKKHAEANATTKVTSQVFMNTTPGHNKFWSVSTHGNVMKTTYGKIGTMGSTTTKEFASPSAAGAAAAKLIYEKKAKGYKLDSLGTHEYEHKAGAPVPPAAPAAPKVAGVPPQVKAEFDKLAAQGDFKTLQEILDTGGLKLEVKGYLEKLLAEQQSGKIKHLSGGWKLDPSDGVLSGAPSLTQETKDGYTYYVAKTDSPYGVKVFQVGVIDPEGNPVEHSDYSDAQDAAAQMGQYIMGNNAGLPFPLAADIQSLDPASGPKDGDTKLAVDGGTLVFKNGRWHKQGVVVPDFESLSPGKYGTMYANVASVLTAAVASDGLAGLKKLVVFHKNGSITVDVPGTKLKGLTGNAHPSPPQKKARQDAMFKLVMALKAEAQKTPKGKKVAFTTAAPGAMPKPAATATKPAQAAPQAKVFVTAPPGKPGVTVIDGWAQTGPQKGSNPGGKFKDKNGQEWYCKFPASEDHVKNELLASKLYKAAGVDVPTLRMVEKDGKIGIASKIVDGVTKVGAGIKNASGAMEGFAVDAWLGNYDSVGTGYDNLLKTKDGKAIRIDVGGSLLYRAQGAPKGDGFGNEVVEIDAMRDAAKNQFGASVFSTITKEKLNESVALVLDVPDDIIQQIVSKFGPGNNAAKAALAAKLIARKNDLAKKYPGADLIVNPPKPDPRKLPVDTSSLPKKLDFLNWKGAGQGLSGTAKVNEVNQAAVDQIYTAAMNGDFVALKKLKFHIVDKATGAVKEGALFGDHPSQHVKDFYSTVLDYMEVVANPAAKKAKSWDIGDYSDINELSDGFKAHYYGVTVGQVPANQRLGFWISLGQADAAKEFMPPKVEYISAAGKAKGVASTKGMTAILKKWMAAVKQSGSYNTPYREGKEIDNSGLKARDVLTDAYAHAVELDEGTRITKGISMPDAMLKQMMALPPGHVFQNPGSMCCSINENWSWGGNARLKIVYAKGAKALYNIGVGSYNGEGEITTIPGQRFMLMETKNDGSTTEFTVLMLPPDESYVANIKPKA